MGGGRRTWGLPHKRPHRPSSDHTGPGDFFLGSLSHSSNCVSQSSLQGKESILSNICLAAFQTYHSKGKEKSEAFSSKAFPFSSLSLHSTRCFSAPGGCGTRRLLFLTPLRFPVARGVWSIVPTCPLHTRSQPRFGFRSHNCPFPSMPPQNLLTVPQICHRNILPSV